MPSPVSFEGLRQAVEALRPPRLTALSAGARAGGARGQMAPLRICLECGHVGCCDDSPNRHATRARRARSASDHPVGAAAGSARRARPRAGPARAGGGQAQPPTRPPRGETPQDFLALPRRESRPIRGPRWLGWPRPFGNPRAGGSRSARLGPAGSCLIRGVSVGGSSRSESPVLETGAFWSWPILSPTHSRELPHPRRHRRCVATGC
jgi:hypothetical protein